MSQAGEAREGWPLKLLAWIAAADLFCLMWVVAIDVAGRYLFNKPLPAGYEMVQALMGVLAFSALPLISARNEHISVGLLDHLFRGAAHRARLALVHAASGVVLAFIGWRLWAHALKLARDHDATPVLGIPLAPFGFGMVVLTAFSVLLLAALAWRAARGAGG